MKATAGTNTARSIGAVTRTVCTRNLSLQCKHWGALESSQSCLGCSETLANGVWHFCFNFPIYKEVIFSDLILLGFCTLWIEN